MQIGNFNAELINTGFSDGQFNMDYDLDLVRQVQNGRNACFRVYGWSPWCLSLGKNQKLDKIDKDQLEKDNYQLVYRPTGGRAVFHSNELTYSFVSKIKPGEEKEIYKNVHLFFSDILEKFNIRSDFVKSNPEFSKLYKEDKSVSCFASSARNELTINGKKIIGSAQRIIGDILLQHGSLPIDNSYLDIVDYSITDKKDELRSYLKKVSTSLINETSHKIDFDVLVKEIEDVTDEN